MQLLFNACLGGQLGINYTDKMEIPIMYLPLGPVKTSGFLLVGGEC